MANQYKAYDDKELLAAYAQYGTKAAAADALGCHRNTVADAIKRARKAELSDRGVSSPAGMEVTRVSETYDAEGEIKSFSVSHTGAVEPPATQQGETLPGFAFKRISTNYAADGRVLQSWEIQSPERVKVFEAMKVAAAAMVQEIPRAQPIAAPPLSDDMLCTTYTLTDAHIGMLAWHREGGEDWDLGIAESVIVSCFERAIMSSPPSKQAILNQLGDLLHYDSLSAVTPTSGHVLDADGRFTKMVEIAVRVLRRVIALILEKHESLHLILAEGNHDMAGSVWLRTMFKVLYENEPRITVDDSALPFYAFEWGKTMQVFHHSHLVKFDDIGRKVPAMFDEMWGRCPHRYVHTGNYHHRREKDENGIETIQHPTLAARDAYAARGAWFAKRAIIPITYHKELGEVMRSTISPAMIRLAVAA
jgi:hypothetical protein